MTAQARRNGTAAVRLLFTMAHNTVPLALDETLYNTYVTYLCHI